MLLALSYNIKMHYPATADQDYTGLPGVFSFVSGQTFSCIRITIIDDSIIETEETLTLTLLPEDSSPGVRVSRGQSTVEITDNDEGILDTWSCIILYQR